MVTREFNPEQNLQQLKNFNPEIRIGMARHYYGMPTLFCSTANIILISASYWISSTWYARKTYTTGTTIISIMFITIKKKIYYIEARANEYIDRNKGFEQSRLHIY